MWVAQFPFLEDENGEAILKAFVELSATYSNYTPMQIAEHVFTKFQLKDALLRHAQAAASWHGDIDIQERIRKARLNGGTEPGEIALKTKEQRIKELEVMAETSIDPDTRIKAYELIAKMNGEIVKPIDLTTKGEQVWQPQPIIYKPYADA